MRQKRHNAVSSAVCPSFWEGGSSTDEYRINKYELYTQKIYDYYWDARRSYVTSASNQNSYNFWTLWLESETTQRSVGDSIQPWGTPTFSIEVFFR